MKNADKIKQQQKELGRYMKKVGDMQKEEAKLKAELQTAYDATLEMQTAMDAILSVLAKKYGTEEKEDGNVIGWRIELPCDDIRQSLANTRVVTQKREEENMYIVGVFPKE